MVGSFSGVIGLDMKSGGPLGSLILARISLLRSRSSSNAVAV
jgi:hypothetical protein